MLIAVLALTMTAATLTATAFGFYGETRKNRMRAEADRVLAFRTMRRFSIGAGNR